MSDAVFDYTSEPQPEQAEIIFTGPYRGETLTWHATVMSLGFTAEHDSDAEPAAIRQFIDMDEPCGGHCAIRVGLCVEAIDARVLLKTVIMLRQYKRLRPGRHEYGEPCPQATNPAATN